MATGGEDTVHPGEYLLDEAAGAIEANQGRATIDVVVRHTGDRPIQIGSHFHFFEANRTLVFERAAAYGMRLNIPAGTAMRFEPGEEKIAPLVAFGGSRLLRGHNGLIDGLLDAEGTREQALTRLRESGFAVTSARGQEES
jgi:urease beta subunit